MRRFTPSNPAAASKYRPMLEVAGELTPRASMDAIVGAAGSSAKRRAISALAPAARERGGRHAPRLARGDVAARQAQRRKMAEALATRAVDAQQLAAPRSPVGAEAHAVERQTEHGRRDPMLGDDRGDVRMMVLNAELRDSPVVARAAPRGAC